MTQEEIIISVIVLAYNQETTIENTLDAILQQQTDYSFEVIIGEDASSDKTRLLCQRYVDKYPDCIRLMPEASNKGILRNYADCFTECRGKYIAACAGDDWWHCTTKLQNQVDFLENNIDYGVVYTDFDMYFAGTRKLIKNYNRSLKIELPSEWIYRYLLCGNRITAVTACYRRSVCGEFVDFLLMDRLHFIAEDYPMWLELSNHCKFKYMDFSSSTYRVAHGSVTNNKRNVEHSERFAKAVLSIREYYLTKYPIEGVSFSDIRDIFYKDIYNVAFYNGDRFKAIASLEKINNKTYKDSLKHFIAKYPLLFYIYYYVYKLQGTMR